MCAKKKTKTTQSKSSADDFFHQLIDEHNELYDGATASGDEMFSDVRMWLPTGALALDTIVSNRPDGGWPVGRTIEVYGEEAIGKSTLGFQTMAQCQKLGGIPIFYDVEQAGSKQYMQACGVDTSKLVASKLVSIEEIFTTLEKTLQTIIDNPVYDNKPIFVCMDSLAQMTTDDEIEGEYQSNMNIEQKKAKQLGKALRKITPYLSKANACLMIINQQRDDPGKMFGDPKRTPGGNALKFAASVRVKVRSKGAIKQLDPAVQAQYDAAMEQYENQREQHKAGEIKAKPKKPRKGDYKGETTIIGYDVEAMTEKNKVAPPKRKARFRIMFGKGIVEEEAWFDYALKQRMIEKTGNSWKLTLTGETFARDDWLDVLSDQKVYDQIRDQVVNSLVLTESDNAVKIKESEDESEDENDEDDEKKKQNN